MFGWNRRQEEEPPQDNLHVLCILDRTGHTEVRFDPADPVAVARVREQFDAIMSSQKSWAYTLDNGTEGEFIREFDPSARETYISPQIVGG
jgi:hypothetical protein